MPTFYGYKLLVVDDSPAMCRLAEAVLKGVVSQVRLCTSGREALEVWARWKPRIVLVDYEMPELNGMMFARALRQLEPEAGFSSVLLMLTSYVTPDVVQEAGAAGYDGFIPKPLSAEAFTRQLERLGRDEREQVLID